MSPPLWLIIIMLNHASAFEGPYTFMSVGNSRGKRERESRRLRFRERERDSEIEGEKKRHQKVAGSACWPRSIE